MNECTSKRARARGISKCGNLLTANMQRRYHTRCRLTSTSKLPPTTLLVSCLRLVSGGPRCSTRHCLRTTPHISEAFCLTSSRRGFVVFDNTSRRPSVSHPCLQPIADWLAADEDYLYAFVCMNMLHLMLHSSYAATWSTKVFFSRSVSRQAP